MTSTTKIKLISWLLWLLAFGLVAWTLTQLPLDEIATSIRSLSAMQWIFWMGLNLVIILLLTWRWQLLVNALNDKVNLWRLLLIRQAGQTVSFITPGPQFGGEPLQIFWLYKRCSLPLHKAILSLGMDRFYELWINFSMLLLGVFLLFFSPALDASAWQKMGAVLLVLLLLLSLLAWAILRQPQWLSARVERLARRWQEHPRLSRIENHWQALSSDLRTAIRTQKPRLLMAVLLSIAGWIGLIGELALIMAFVDVQLDLSGFILIMVAMRLALLLPVPGGIGTLEASVLWSFQTLNLPASAAIGLIALMRARDAIVLLAGFACLRGFKTPTVTAQS
ncbi:MAG TPA: lysylphosphatidylglycerol synthase transmembrane domain-containing protein [Cellvibrio sp.]|nr:lysylphosphatidylglycerol synthase transmembrane domain-containing protein [Cellvibrio sp.]